MQKSLIFYWIIVSENQTASFSEQSAEINNEYAEIRGRDKAITPSLHHFLNKL